MKTNRHPWFPHSAPSNIRSRRDARQLLPPRRQGLGHRLLLHAGGHHHARHHPGVRVGRKCLRGERTRVKPRGAESPHCSPTFMFAENQPKEALLQDQTQQVQRVGPAQRLLPVLLCLGRQHPALRTYAQRTAALLRLLVFSMFAPTPTPHSVCPAAVT